MENPLEKPLSPRETVELKDLLTTPASTLEFDHDQIHELFIRSAKGGAENSAKYLQADAEEIAQQSGLSPETVRAYLAALEKATQKPVEPLYLMVDTGKPGGVKHELGTLAEQYASSDETLERVRSTWDDPAWREKEEHFYAQERAKIESRPDAEFEITPGLRGKGAMMKQGLLQSFRIPPTSSERAESLRKDEGGTNNAWMFFSSEMMIANARGECWKGLSGNFDARYLNEKFDGAWDHLCQDHLSEVIKTMAAVDAYCHQETGAKHPDEIPEISQALRKMALHLYDHHKVPPYFIGGI